MDTGLNPYSSAVVALTNAASVLSTVSDSPRLDAELLMAHALGINRSELLLRLRDVDVPATFAALVDRRSAHEPVAYITGTQAFWDIVLRVTPDVLIPRADSETLIEAAVEAFADQDGANRDGANRAPPGRILDLGTGSGALLLAALSAFRGATGTGIDASMRALAVAQRNAVELGFATRTTMQQRSWHDTNWAADLGAPFDLILCNPPYIETSAIVAPMVNDYEPHAALYAGPDGLDDYRVIIPTFNTLLAPDGVAVVEIGHMQAESVAALAQSAGLSSVLRRDLAGLPRALVMIKTRDKYSPLSS